MNQNTDQNEQNTPDNLENTTPEVEAQPEILTEGLPLNHAPVSEEPSTEDLLAQERDRYIRLYAEFENFKKRTIKEKMEFFQYASQDLMVSMLAVLDDFERALKEISKTGDQAQIQGVELIYNKFKNKLIEKGLKPLEINPGDTFNVDQHEAITSVPAPTEDLKGKIVDVVETGYQLHDRVIRFAKVVTGN